VQPVLSYTDKARLSYAESYSLVEYLLDNYGQDKMLNLLNILKQGSTYDEALIEVYGFDINGLDASWRATLTNAVVLAQKAGLHPVLIGVLAALGVGLALWGALPMRKRIWRRSSGKSAK